jgi:MFS family permease
MSLNDHVPESILRYRPFVLYWNARVFTAIASQMASVAVAWQMYAITGNAFDLGLVGLVQFLPSTVLVLIAGQFADRYDRRRILQICQCVEGIAAASLAYATFTGAISKDFILTAVFFLGAARAFEAPTMLSLLPAIVPAPLFPRAVAASSTAQQAATIGGPAIGGVLYLISPTSVYLMCFALYILAATQLTFVHIQSALASGRPPLTFKALFAGVSFIRHNPIVLGVISLDLFAVLLGGATALLPIFAKDVFDVGPSGLGILRAAPAVGAISMMVALAHWPITHSVGKVEFTAVGLFGIATIVFGLSTSFWVSIIALALMGAADAISVVIRLTFVQLETPDHMRGRVSAVNSLFVNMSNQLGDFRAGIAAGLMGAIPAVLFGGLGTLLVVALGIKLFPELYHAEHFTGERAGAEEYRKN